MWAWLEKILAPNAYMHRVNAARMEEWRRACDAARAVGTPPPPPPNWVSLR